MHISNGVEKASFASHIVDTEESSPSDCSPHSNAVYFVFWKIKPLVKDFRMNLFNAAGRIRRFLMHRRREILTKPFWNTVFRVVKNRFNYFQRVSAEQFRKNIDILDQRPCTLHIELTNLCNANCIFCAYQFQTRPRSFISDVLYNKALDDYCALGGGDLRLEVIVGDPCVDPKFIQRIKEARKRKEIRKIRTITNLIALNINDIPDLLKSGLSHIQVSSGPLREDLYSKIYRNRSYQKVLKNIKYLVKHNQELGCPVEIKLAFRSNLSMQETLLLKDYLDISKYPHEVEFNTDFDTWRGHIGQSDLIEGMRIRPAVKLEREPCIWLYEGPIVFEDGKVGLCACRDFNADSELIVGNIKELSLGDIWRSEPVKLLRSGFYEAKYPKICRNCTQYINLDFFRTSIGTKQALSIDRPRPNLESNG